MNIKEKISVLERKLAQLQRACRNLNIPIMIAFEGFGASGKGIQIAELIRSLDPRGFEVYAVKNESEEEKKYPFLWRILDEKCRQKGRIAIYDSSWYRKVLIDRFEKKVGAKRGSVCI